jgi:hypothetical protein
MVHRLHRMLPGHLIHNIGGKEVSVSGRLLRVAKLRHEGFEFLDLRAAEAQQVQQHPGFADLFTFLRDIGDDDTVLPFSTEKASAAILPVTTYASWWKGLDFRVRNKIRKALKTGVEIRNSTLDDNFVRGVEAIYSESPVRQGRKFVHYAQSAASIKEELSSLFDRSGFLGAYCGNELIGFAKLFYGKNVLRTVHIIAKLAHRDKAVQDALIARAVQICDEKRISYFQYGSWSEGSLGAFKVKRGFKKFDYSRYYVPLTPWGRLALRLQLHHGIKGWLSHDCITSLRAMRNAWNNSRYRRRFRMAGPLANRA